MIFGYKSGKQQNIQVFYLSGELIDRNQGKELLAEIETSIANGENKIMLNLQRLDYINSSGLNVLINILTKTRKASGDTAICCVNKKVTELLVITKLDSIFNVCDNEEEAMEILCS
jgi:anti-sigma B factor antagonist